MNEILDVILRSALSLVALFFLTKLLGKKQISQLSVFEYIIGITIGSIAAEGSLNLDYPLINSIVVMTVYVVIVFLMSFLTLKSMLVRKLFTGVPTVLIERGKIIESGLKKCMLDINDLLEECRNKGYFDLNQLDYAIMETSGKVSFLPKSEYRPLKGKDIDVYPPYEGILANVIVDGEIQTSALKGIDKDNRWLLKTLKKQGFNNLDSILLATLDATNKITVFTKNEPLKKTNILE